MLQPYIPGVSSLLKWYRNEYYLLFLCWLVVTLINVNKAFHIDDTFHLEAAKWISGHPFSPMSGTINWYNDPEQFGKGNQPVLYFYIIAGWSWIFGWSEIMLHLMQSVFTLLCILFFFKIVKVFSRGGALAITVLFAFNPAFIVNQNLMTDIPVLSFLLMFIYVLIKPDAVSDRRRYVTASLLLAIGLLIKYSLFPMLGVLVLDIIMRRKYRFVYVLLIPLFVLTLWSLWNYFDFGAAQLLQKGRVASLPEINFRANSFLLCLGAVSFFPLFILPGIFRDSKFTSAFVLVTFVSFLVFVVLVFCEIVPEASARELLSSVFLFNGYFVLLAVCFCFFRSSSFRKRSLGIDRPMAIVYMWLAAVTLFIVCYAPFIATRHVLLVLPAILIITSKIWEKVPGYIKAIAVTGTIASGFVLGISDWQFADFYRRAASDINVVGTGSKVWSDGHWGWQWYCSTQQIVPFGTTTSDISVGDYIVTPRHVAKQDFHRLHFTRVKTITYAPGIFSFFCVSTSAGFYSTNMKEIPWSLSKAAIDTIDVFRVSE